MLDSVRSLFSCSTFADVPGRGPTVCTSLGDGFSPHIYIVSRNTALSRGESGANANFFCPRESPSPARPGSDAPDSLLRDVHGLPDAMRPKPSSSGRAQGRHGGRIPWQRPGVKRRGIPRDRSSLALENRASREVRDYADPASSQGQPWLAPRLRISKTPLYALPARPSTGENPAWTHQGRTRRRAAMDAAAKSDGVAKAKGEAWFAERYRFPPPRSAQGPNTCI